MLSAQRFKNNELQNRLNEVIMEMEKLKEENKTLRRVHQREELALKKFESHDIDLSRIMKTHNDEIGVVKEMLKKSKAENKRINNLLLDKEDELRTMKKKNEEYKNILNDKKLIDTHEINKKLEQTDKELQEYKQKSEVSK